MVASATSLDVLFLLAMNQMGGAEKSMLTVAEGLQAEGLRVGVAVYGTRAELISPATCSCTVFPLHATTTLGALLPLMDLLRGQRVPVLVSALRHTNLAAILAAKLTGTRVVVTEHSASGVLTQHRNWKHRLVRHLIHLFYGKADAIVAVSKGIAQELRTMLGSTQPIHVIYNPIVTDIYSAVLPLSPHTLFEDTGIPVVIAIGRLSPEKDMATLLRAFAKVRASTAARLVILGEGPERAALEALSQQLGIGRDVLFAGYADDIRAWLARARVFVSTSRFEGFGNAIVEAMACGVPVIATDCPVGPGEILEQGKYGTLVKVGDVNAIADAITRTLANPPATAAALVRAQDFRNHISFERYGALIRSVQSREASASLWQRIHRKFTSIFLYEHWMIGIIDAPIETALTWKECPKVQWLGNTSGSYYLADPFPVPDPLGNILCEYFDYKTRRGNIREISLDNNIIKSEAHVNIGTSGHLSFPFTFTHEAQVFCMPESSAARCLTIYCQGVDKSWQLYATPLPDTAAVDSALFTHEGRFWIAYTDADIGSQDNLNLIYADTLDGKWHAHAANPVKRDKRTARCAGTPFRVHGALYRPAQDCSKTYGGALSIMHITHCSPTAYEEIEVNHIAPETGINPHGLHTLSAWGSRCLVDGKRLRFSFGALWRKVLRRLS